MLFATSNIMRMDIFHLNMYLILLKIGETVLFLYM